MLPCGVQFGSDCSREPRILGQAKEVIDAVQLAPMHQLFAGKPCVGAQQMRRRGQRARMWSTMRVTSSTAPALASMLERRNLAAKEVPAAKNVKRQVAVAIVIAVEEAPLLVPMQRVVSGIQIENDLPRRTGMGLDK